LVKGKKASKGLEKQGLDIRNLKRSNWKQKRLLVRHKRSGLNCGGGGIDRAKSLGVISERGKPRPGGTDRNGHRKGRVLLRKKESSRNVEAPLERGKRYALKGTGVRVC